jgi:hypothetical protein
MNTVFIITSMEDADEFAYNVAEKIKNDED